MTTLSQRAPGDLDRGFASDGSLVLSFPGFPVTNGVRIAEAPDNKIYALGTSHLQEFDERRVSIVCLLPDGIPDPDFGTLGIVHIKLPSKNFSAAPIQIYFLPDDEQYLILVSIGYGVYGVGSITQTQVLMRLTATGQLDARFGEDGFVTLKPPFEAVAAQPSTADAVLSTSSSASAVYLNDDKIYLITSGVDPVLGVNTGVVSCFNLDGTEHTAFGKDGHAALSEVLKVRSGLNGIVVDDGKIFVSGWAIGGALLACLNLDGSFDLNFAGTGYTLLPGPSFQYESIAVLPDGRPVVAGFGNTPRTGLLAVFTRDGLIDPTFNGGTHIEETFNNYEPIMYLSVAIQDDSIIVGGRFFIGITPYFGAAKYSSLGELDPTFGDGKGWVMPKVPVRRALNYGMSLQTDKKILMTGSDFDGYYGRAVIATRLLNSD